MHPDCYNAANSRAAPPLPLGIHKHRDEWEGDGGMIVVEFDGDSRVSDKKYFEAAVPGQPSLIDRIMSWK
jgi:hypothetical protein